MSRLAAGLVLMGLGGVVVLAGIGGALWEMAGLYGAVLGDPLGPSAEGEEVRGAMLRWVGVGAAGVVPLVAGSVLVKGWLARRVARKASTIADGP